MWEDVWLVLMFVLYHGTTAFEANGPRGSRARPGRGSFGAVAGTTTRYPGFALENSALDGGRRLGTGYGLSRAPGGSSVPRTSFGDS